MSAQQNTRFDVLEQSDYFEILNREKDEKKETFLLARAERRLKNKPGHEWKDKLFFDSNNRHGYKRRGVTALFVNL